MENLEKKYICKYCDKEFKRKRSLTFHINVKHLKITKANCKTVTTKKKCSKCGREVTIINFNKHLRACGKPKGRKEITEILSKCTIKDNKYICPICNKEYCKMGIATHIWRCHTNQGEILNPNDGYKKGTRIAWNKGLTKETDERIKKYGETYSKNHKLGLHKKPEYRRRLKAVQTKYGWYNGYYCDSSWELAFLIYNLDVGNKVIREERSFNYIHNNEVHKYYPDFLINSVYYEIKGRDDIPEITIKKLEAVRDCGFDIKIINSKDIKFYINYVKRKYRVKNIWNLYNNIKSSLIICAK